MKRDYLSSLSRAARWYLPPAADMFLSELWGVFIQFHIDLPLSGLANSSRYAELFFPVGMVLCFVWFQRNGGRGRTLPKKMLLFFPLVLLGMAWVWFLAWIVFEERFALLNFLFPDQGWLLRLVLARLEDRRWRAVYMWALTGAMLSIFLLKFLTNMSFDGFREGWQIPYWTQLTVLTAAGVLGTAVSLC